MSAFFLNKGIKDIANTLTGNENVYLGIRPYGFHAGNMLPLVVYPLLLCDELTKIKIEPRFTFFVFINDWEQDGLSCPDVKNYPFNIYPKNTTFQYMESKEKPLMNMVDYWEPVILENVKRIQQEYPSVRINSIRNSEMKYSPVMKKYLLLTIKKPNIIANILRKHTKNKVLKRPLAYAMAICPNCQKAKGESKVEKEDMIIHTCEHCGKVTKNIYENFDYWFYHKPLAIPRLEVYDIDICITGLDHYNEGDYTSRQELIKAYKSKAKMPKTLYTPIVLGKNGRVMGKSRGNTEVIDTKYLQKLVKKNKNKEYIKIS